MAETTRESAAPPATGARSIVDVAVGVLVGPDHRFLLTSRPAGKVYAGYWEFPGGKMEAGETVAQALRRELQEELGITIGDAHPWKVDEVDYPHARVRLHFCRVYAWQGELQMREGQRMAWQNLPVQVQPVLPGTIPVLDWMAQEQGFTQATHYTGPMEENAAWLDAVQWDRDGLVPVIAQEAGSGDVLMFAWMNRTALASTAASGQAVYYSRSRQKLWHKGEESGHFQRVHEIRMDCDNDVVLLKVTQLGRDPNSPGVACHTGRHSCFYQRLEHNADAPVDWRVVEPVLVDPERVYKK
jgi:mutator protein MutT